MNLITLKVELSPLGESKPIHSRSMTEHEWILRNNVVDELNEYKTSELLKIMQALFPQI